MSHGWTGGQYSLYRGILPQEEPPPEYRGTRIEWSINRSNKEQVHDFLLDIDRLTHREISALLQKVKFAKDPRYAAELLDIRGKIPNTPYLLASYSLAACATLRAMAKSTTQDELLSGIGGKLASQNIANLIV